MKPFLLIFCWLFASSIFAQEGLVEIRSAEYVWERQNGDNRVVIAQDTNYQQVIKKCIIDAIKDKWNADVPPFTVSVNKLPALRSQPRFNGTVENADSNSTYIFLQLFDKSIPYEVQQYSAYTAIIDARCRVIRQGEVKDRKVTFHVMKTNAPGQIRIKRYPFHPSSLLFACDTIAQVMFDEVQIDSRDLWLHPAYAYVDHQEHNGEKETFKYDMSRQSLEVAGGQTFTIRQDSVRTVETGKRRHAGENMATGLLTVLSNIDTDKKRSTLYTTEHFLTVGADNYSCAVNYIDTRVAERRRVKDEEGYKSIERGDYQPGWREIKPDAVHVITLNGDTVSTFTIAYRRNEEQFNKMWNGKDSTTIDSMPAAFNNYPKQEMELKGGLGDKPFVLSTSDEGKIKTLRIMNHEVFTWKSNGKAEGEMFCGNITEREKNLATILCFLSDKYY